MHRCFLFDDSYGIERTAEQSEVTNSPVDCLLVRGRFHEFSDATRRVVDENASCSVRIPPSAHTPGRYLGQSVFPHSLHRSIHRSNIQQII